MLSPFLFFLLGLLFANSKIFAQIGDGLYPQLVYNVLPPIKSGFLYEVPHSSLQNFPNDTMGGHVLNFHFGIKKHDVAIEIDPILQLNGGIDNVTKSKAFDLFGGVRAEVRTKKIVFNVSAAKGFTKLSGYQNEYTLEHEVIPGMGYARAYKNGYFYNYLATNFWYKPSKYFYLQLGYDKNFIGDGYRSLLLSDNASNYPFLKLVTSVWKLKYVNIYAEFNDIRNANGNSALFQKKFGAFHYLDWEVNKRLTVGLFETIIWQAANTKGLSGFNFNYLNPIIFYRPVEFSIGSPDNALMGTNVKLRLWKNTFLYSQIILDEFYLEHIRARDGWWANKQGLQLGFKVYDLFRIKNLYVQMEANYVRPFTYSHYNTLQNYGHYNQPLAHPLGSNFIESVNFIKYKYKKVYFEYECMVAMKGENIDTLNYGADLYESYVTFTNEFGNYVGQGLRTFIFYNSLKCSYVFNKTNQMGFFVQVIDRRKYSSIINEDTMLFMAGIQICPIKRYADY